MIRSSVVVCAYRDDRYDHLVRAVESLHAQSSPPEEVIVVADGNPELLERARRTLPDAVVIAHAGAPGLSGARNSGVARARTELVAFLDDDAHAAPDWLELLVRPYENDTVAGVGGWIEPLW